MGSQEKETIAKYLEDSVNMSEGKEINGVGIQRIVNGNLDMIQSQPNNSELCVLKSTAGPMGGGECGLLGGIDTNVKSKKRGYDELILQASVDSQIRPLE